MGLKHNIKTGRPTPPRKKTREDYGRALRFRSLKHKDKDRIAKLVQQLKGFKYLVKKLIAKAKRQQQIISGMLDRNKFLSDRDSVGDGLIQGLRVDLAHNRTEYTEAQKTIVKLRGELTGLQVIVKGKPHHTRDQEIEALHKRNRGLRAGIAEVIKERDDAKALIGDGVLKEIEDLKARIGGMQIIIADKKAEIYNHQEWRTEYLEENTRLGDDIKIRDARIVGLKADLDREKDDHLRPDFKSDRVVKGFVTPLDQAKEKIKELEKDLAARWEEIMKLRRQRNNAQNQLRDWRDEIDISRLIKSQASEYESKIVELEKKIKRMEDLCETAYGFCDVSKANKGLKAEVKRLIGVTKELQQAVDRREKIINSGPGDPEDGPMILKMEKEIKGLQEANKELGELAHINETKIIELGNLSERVQIDYAGLMVKKNNLEARIRSFRSDLKGILYADTHDLDTGLAREKDGE